MNDDLLLPYAGLTPQQHWIVLEAICRAEQSSPIVGFRDLAVDWEADLGATRASKSKLGNQCLRLFHRMGFVEFDESSLTAHVKDTAREWYAAVAGGDNTVADNIFRQGLARLWFTDFDGQPDWDTVGTEIQRNVPDAEGAAIESALQLLEYYGFLGGQGATDIPTESGTSPSQPTDLEAHPFYTETEVLGHQPIELQGELEEDDEQDRLSEHESYPHNMDAMPAQDEYEDTYGMASNDEPYPTQEALENGDYEQNDREDQMPETPISSVPQFNEMNSAGGDYESPNQALKGNEMPSELPPTASRRPTHEEVKPSTPNYEELLREEVAEPPSIGHGRGGDDEDDDIEFRRRNKPKTGVGMPSVPESFPVKTPPVADEAEQDEVPKGPRAGRKREIDMHSISEARERGASATSAESDDNHFESGRSGKKLPRQIPDDNVTLPRRTTGDGKRGVAVDEDEETVTRGAGRRKKSKSLEEGDIIDLRDIRRPTTKLVRDDDPLGRVRRKMDDSSVQRGDGRRSAGQGFRNQGPRATPISSHSTSTPNDEPDGVVIPIRFHNVMIKVIVPPEIAEGLNQMELMDEAYRLVKNIMESSQQGHRNEADPDDLD